MSHRRSLAGAVAAAALALTIAPHALPASASVGASDPVAASRAVSGRPLIQGVVTDQTGRYVDDVEVVATRSDDTAAASALTYASDREDGPQHGYFFLEVPRGTYTLTLSKAGYQTRELGGVQVTRRGQHVSLGEIELRKKAAESTTRAELARGRVTTRQSGSVEVTVSTRATGRPTGDVEVREGRKVVGEGTLKQRDKGALDIQLDRLAKGEHTLKAYYLGAALVKASASKAFTLTVTKARH